MASFPPHALIRGGFAVLAVFSLAGAAQAQQSGERLTGVVAGGYSTKKIAVPTATSNRPVDEAAQELVTVLRDDLEFHWAFDVVDPQLYRLVPGATGGEEPYGEWLSVGVEWLTRLSVRSGDGRVDIEARLHDTQGGGLIFARRYAGTEDLVRRIAHTIADDFVKQLTGAPGVATTRIAFVSKEGKGKEVFLMDYDGRNIRRITNTGTINLAPTWSPDGEELLYLSWRAKQPAVYVMSSEGKLGSLATVGGELTAAPDWSPDGRRVVYSAQVDGNSELFMLDRSSGRNTRLTRNPAIDTAPAFSPNGREIAFTSDRTGNPQIFLMDAEGLNVRRVSYNAPYNDSAAWSPSGDRLAYASRIDGRFDIVVLDMSSEQVTRLTRGEGNSENPRWSPDGRYIVFSSNRSGGYQIYVMRADGTDLRRMTRGEDSYTPDWSR